jgi:hypothetical protein
MYYRVTDYHGKSIPRPRFLPREVAAFVAAVEATLG